MTTPDESGWEAMRTAMALVAANRRHDYAGMVELWNEAVTGPASAAVLVNALTTLPSVVAEELAAAMDIEVDLDEYFDAVLRGLAAECDR